MDLNAEFQRLYNGSPVEAREQFKTLQERKEKARELADLIGSIVTEENLPLEVLEILADTIKEDCEQIRQAIKEMNEDRRD